jgi:hypothetical protein
MTFNSQDMANLLPVIAQFAQIPVEKWGENLEPQSHTIRYPLFPFLR